MKLTAAALLAAVALTGCGGTAAEDTSPKPKKAATFQTPDTLDPWPLTIPALSIGCNGDSLFGNYDGKRYALNGTAQARLGFPSISTVQAEGSNLTPLLDRARTLC